MTATTYVPSLDDAALDGVRTRRVMAFVLDYVLIAILLVPAWLLVAVFGLLTFGLAWAAFAVLGPAVALIYVAVTMGGPRQATLGMRAMDIVVERLDGQRIDGMTAIMHTVLFWAGNAILSPLILLGTLFTWRKRTLHDMLLATQVVRTSLRH